MDYCSPSYAAFVKKTNILNLSVQNVLEREAMKQIFYASVVGSLMYAQVFTRPDTASSQIQEWISGELLRKS